MLTADDLKEDLGVFTHHKQGEFSHISETPVASIALLLAFLSAHELRLPEESTTS
jgi:hypothetical protein